MRASGMGHILSRYSISHSWFGYYASRICKFLFAADQDYIDSEEVVLQFSPGNTRILSSIELRDDNVFELDEVFSANLTLLESSPRVTVNPEYANITVLDNDSKNDINVVRNNPVRIIP